MNAIERSERRVRRFSILKQIECIELENCAICPNRTSTDNTCCKVCPVPDRLSELGKQLIAMTHREEKPEVVVTAEVKKRKNSYVYERRRAREKLGIPPKKIPKVKPPSAPKRQPGDPSIIFTADDYIRSVANGEYKSEIARRIGMPDSTLYHRTVKWDLVGLTTDQAKEMLKQKQESAK